MTDFSISPESEAVWKSIGLGSDQVGAKYLERAQAYLHSASQFWGENAQPQGVDQATWDSKFQPQGYGDFASAAGKDGIVSQQEFVDLASKSALKAEFAARDTNGDGSLSNDEWNQAGLEGKLGVTTDEADTDDNSVVSEDEFVSAIGTALEAPTIDQIHQHLETYGAEMDGINGDEKDGVVSTVEYMVWRVKAAAFGIGRVTDDGNTALQAIVNAHPPGDANQAAGEYFDSLEGDGHLVKADESASPPADEAPADGSADPVSEPDTVGEVRPFSAEEMTALLGVVGSIGSQSPSSPPTMPTPGADPASTNPQDIVDQLVSTTQVSEASLIAGADAQGDGERPFTSQEMSALQSVIGQISG